MFTICLLASDWFCAFILLIESVLVVFQILLFRKVDFDFVQLLKCETILRLIPKELSVCLPVTSTLNTSQHFSFHYLWHVCLPIILWDYSVGVRNRNSFGADLILFANLFGTCYMKLWFCCHFLWMPFYVDTLLRLNRSDFCWPRCEGFVYFYINV